MPRPDTHSSMAGDEDGAREETDAERERVRRRNQMALVIQHTQRRRMKRREVARQKDLLGFAGRPEDVAPGALHVELIRAVDLPVRVWTPHPRAHRHTTLNLTTLPVPHRLTTVANTRVPRIPTWS